MNRRVLVVAVVLIGPQAGQCEGADKADEVENAPGIEPGDQRDAEIKNGQVGKQRQHLVAARGDQQGRGETFECGNDRQNRRFLQNGQRRAEQRNGKQKDKAGFVGDEVVQLHRRQRCQIKHADAHALQNQRVIPTALAQEPAQAEQSGARDGNAGVAQLDRKTDVLGGKAEQEGQPKEENQHADLNQRIDAVEQIAHRLGEPIFERNGWFWGLRGCGRSRLLRCWLGGRCGEGAVGFCR